MITNSHSHNPTLLSLSFFLVLCTNLEWVSEWKKSIGLLEYRAHQGKNPNKRRGLLDPRKMKMGALVWVVFSAILWATLLPTCSFALSQDGFLLSFYFHLQFYFYFQEVLFSFFLSLFLPIVLSFNVNFLIFLFLLGVTLLEFKRVLNDSKNSLRNWVDSDESPCKWTGISCYPQDQKVQSMYAPVFNLF